MKGCNRYRGVVRKMAANKNDVFGAEFLPGKDESDHDGATRAMERKFGGQVGAPINSSKSVWYNDFFNFRKRNAKK